MEFARHSHNVPMLIKISLLANLIHHANGLKTPQEQVVLIIHVLPFPQKLNAIQFQVLMAILQLYVL